MTNLKICMDLIGSSSEDNTRYSLCVREISHIKSCQDFSQCIEPDGLEKCARIFHESSYSRGPPVPGETLKKETMQHKGDSCDKYDLMQHNKTVYRNSSKPSPRVLYNFCIGRITDLESRAAAPKDNHVA